MRKCDYCSSREDVRWEVIGSNPGVYLCRYCQSYFGSDENVENAGPSVYEMLEKEDPSRIESLVSSLWMQKFVPRLLD